MYGTKIEKHKKEQEGNDKFVEEVMHDKPSADRIQQIWNQSKRQGEKSREELFRETAIREGFTGFQVNRFLDLP